MNASLFNNKIDTSELDKFAAIIGENPSKGARSPKLWNAVFEKDKLNYSMVPMDVSSHNLFNLLDNLEHESKFIGGAVAVPYKEKVFEWLGKNLTPEASKIGAVNCLFRDNNGHIKGTNTDGEGALKTFTEVFGVPKNKKILLLGTGGAAKSVAAYFSSQLGPLGKMWMCGRDSHGKDYAKSLGIDFISWDDVDNTLKKVDVVINCTSIGFGNQELNSPLTPSQLDFLKEKTIVFDIIYQPLNSILLKQSKEKGLLTLNGLEMNLEQAVLAYRYALDCSMTLEEIRNFMKLV